MAVESPVLAVESPVLAVESPVPSEECPVLAGEKSRFRRRIVRWDYTKPFFQRHRIRNIRIVFKVISNTLFRSILIADYARS